MIPYGQKSYKSNDTTIQYLTQDKPYNLPNPKANLTYSDN